MGYRNIFIENNCKLSIKNSNLVIKQIDETLIPIEDINMIMIDNKMCNLTSYLLDSLTRNNVLVYICDEKHLPTSILLNINSYCRQLKRIKEQMNISKPLQKRMWQNIIIQKVLNQATCLKLLNIPGYIQLENLAMSVQSGDLTNVEATAASVYFRLLYGDYFTRRSDGIINAALNYGYAIIRGMIARSLVAYGFETSIGIFHHSELNNFNLADDIIECFRPLVDLYVTTIVDLNSEELTSEIKREIFNVTNQLVVIDNRKYNIQNAIDYVVMSLSKSYKNNECCLTLPQIIPLKEYSFI